MKRIYLLFILAVILIPSISVKAQIGGDNTFEFVNLTSSARIASMGGDFLAVDDDDITLGIANPSVISPNIDGHLALSFVDYFTDINYGFAMYSRTFEKFGSFAGSIQFIDYGEFQYADETGQINGTFSAGEYAFTLGWGRRLDSLFSIGANIKGLYSSLDTYSAFGLAVDVAGTYHSRSGYVVSLLARNIGRQLSSYVDGNNEPLPFTLQLGMSKQLNHLPFRFSILLNHLEKWDMDYEDPQDPGEIDPFTGEVKEDSGFEDFVDNAIRHLVIGGELMPTKNISLRLGYNFQKRKELTIEDKTATVGLSWGIGIKISKFHISYARNAYHLAGSPNYFTLSTDLKELF